MKRKAMFSNNNDEGNSVKRYLTEEDSENTFVTKLKEENTPGCYVKVRHVLTFMCFLGMFNVCSFRISLSVAIVAMVRSSGHDDSNSTNSSMDVSGDTHQVFEWNSAQQGLLLGSYFYGYVLTNIPGGWMARRYGIRPVLGIAMLLSSIITLLNPVIAKISFKLFVCARILLGLIQGVCTPTMHSVWGKWAPPLERSILISFYMSGDCFSTFVVFPLSGLISDTLGWEAIFYLTGALALVWSIVWLATVHESPDMHPRISEEEKRFIVESIKEEQKNLPDSKTKIPWIAMMTSLPLWAIITAHFGSNWANYTLMTMLPTYLTTVLNFNLSTSGGLSALPFILQFIFIILGGYVTDVIRRKGVMSTARIRKLNSLLGLTVPALCLVLAGYVGYDVVSAIVFFSLSVAFFGLNVPGFKANIVEIAPKYGGITYGISNTIANLSGFLAPQVVGIILFGNNSLSQWQLVFWLAAAMYIMGAVAYLVFGSGEVQYWAEGKSISSKENKILIVENQ